MAKTAADMVAAANAVVPKLNVAEAKAKIAAGALVVDVRDPAEVAASGKVPGAVNVPRGMLEFKADAASAAHMPEFDTARPVVLYCAVGGRAALAGKMLQEMGFSDVSNIGGFKDWVEGGGDVER